MWFYIVKRSHHGKFHTLFLNLPLLRLFSVDNRFNICNIVPCPDKSLDKSHLQDKVAAGDGGAEEAGQGEGEGDGEAQGSGRSVYLYLEFYILHY